MDPKPFVLIIVLLDFGQEGFSYKIPGVSSSKLENGENKKLGAVLKNSPPRNRLEMKTKCNLCKRQNKCKLQETCEACDEICDMSSFTDKPEMYYKLKKSDIVGISSRNSANSNPSDNEDRYYTVGAFKEGRVQTLLQKLLNLNIRGQPHHMIVMVKPKSNQQRLLNHTVIIDTAHVFAPNEGDTKKFEMELHKVGDTDESTEELVEKLNEKLDKVVEEKRKANVDTHLMPEEIDEIIEETIKVDKQPKLTSRVMNDDDDEVPEVGQQKNVDNVHFEKSAEEVNQGEQNQLSEEHKNQKSQSENVATATIQQPSVTHDTESSSEVPHTVDSKASFESTNRENTQDQNESIVTLHNPPISMPPSNSHHIRHEQHLNQEHGGKIGKSHSENLASTRIVQPPSTYAEEEKSTITPLNTISEGIVGMNENHMSTVSETADKMLALPEASPFHSTLNENQNEETIKKDSEVKHENQALLQNKALPDNDISSLPMSKSDVMVGEKMFNEGKSEHNEEKVELIDDVVDLNEKPNIVKLPSEAEVAQTTSKLFHNEGDQQSLDHTVQQIQSRTEIPETVGNSMVQQANMQEAENRNSNARTTSESKSEDMTNIEVAEEVTEDKRLSASPIVPEEIPNHTAIKLVPSVDPETTLGDIQRGIEDSASKLVQDTTTSVKETNDKIKDLVQQIFPETLKNLEEIKLRNNKKIITNLTPEEQSLLSQKKDEAMVGLAPQSKNIYKKHPRTEVMYKKGNFFTTKTPPNKPPYGSKHREAETDPPEFIETGEKDNDAIPFIDRNLLNMNSILNNVRKASQPDSITNLHSLKSEDVKSENPKDAKDTDKTEGVGCKKEEEEEMQYLKVDPPTSYGNSYRSSGLHLPTLDEILHQGKKSVQRPLDLPTKNIEKLPRIHHSNLPVYKAENDGSSEEQEELDNARLAQSIVESKHQGHNEHQYFRNLGRFIPREHRLRRDVPEQIKHKSMFFIGDGIKLPLTLKEFTDGSLHLSIDVKALCNCKHCNGTKRHNVAEIVGNTQVVGKEIADIPIKVYNGDDKPANAVQLVSNVVETVGTEIDSKQGDVQEEKAEVRKREIWNNRIEKIDEASVSPEKLHFLKDIFRFMKNLVSDIDVK